jgi:hypothetical protein
LCVCVCVYVCGCACVLTLCEIQRTARAPDDGLHDRIISAISKRLPPPPPTPPSGDNDIEKAAAQLADRMLFLAKGAPSIGVAETAAKSLVFALRCLPTDSMGLLNVTNQTRVLLLETLTKRKNNIVSPAVFVLLANRVPDFMGLMLAEIVDACSTARSQYRQVDAVEVLHTLVAHIYASSSSAAASSSSAEAAAVIFGNRMPELLGSLSRLLGVGDANVGTRAGKNGEGGKSKQKNDGTSEKKNDGTKTDGVPKKRAKIVKRFLVLLTRTVLR